MQQWGNQKMRKSRNVKQSLLGKRILSAPTCLTASLSSHRLLFVSSPFCLEGKELPIYIDDYIFYFTCFLFYLFIQSLEGGCLYVS